MPSLKTGAEVLASEKLTAFQRMMKERHGVDLSIEEAKIRYLKLLNLFWILSHDPPEPGEPPRDPPPAPWL